jgi:hypothetical protein
MKKIMLVSMLLTVALATQAQLGRKIAPKLEKGMVKTYVCKTTTDASAAGQPAFTITTEDKYTVADVTANGYVMEVVTMSVTNDAAADNIAALAESIGQEMMKGNVVRVETNKDGKPLKVLGIEELKKKMTASANTAVENLYKSVPAIAQALPKDAFLKQLEENCTEENLLNSLQSSTSALALNGKTIMTGAQEEFTKQGMKMKRMYFINGENITTSSSLNMSKDEMKALIIAQLEKSLPADQVNMIKDNIDKVMESGMLKIDCKETASFELQADGWVKTIKVEETMENAGQQVKQTTEVTVK